MLFFIFIIALVVFEDFFFALLITLLAGAFTAG